MRDPKHHFLEAKPAAIEGDRLVDVVHDAADTHRRHRTLYSIFVATVQPVSFGSDSVAATCSSVRHLRCSRVRTLAMVEGRIDVSGTALGENEEAPPGPRRRRRGTSPEGRVVPSISLL